MSQQLLRILRNYLGYHILNLFNIRVNQSTFLYLLTPHNPD